MRAGIVIASLLITAVCILLLSTTWSLPNPAPRLSFSFLGYSNSPTGQRLGVFSITNEDFFAISFGRRVAYIRFDSTNSPVGAGWCSTETNADVPSGGSCTVAAQIPPHDVRCSIMLFVSRQTMRNRLEDAIGLPRRWSGVFPPARVYSIRSAYIIP
jgi:hypothetical protein